MKTVADFYTSFLAELSKTYDKNEAEKITTLAFEEVLNYNRIDISLNKSISVKEEARSEFNRILSLLLNGNPIQYVLGKSWFYGLELMVNKNVLIPRPETEELVDWIVKDVKDRMTNPSLIFDVCTGSGCIALALKKEFPDAAIVAIDNSQKALAVAESNAKKHNLEVIFKTLDALQIDLELKPDVVVSNPPYVLEAEKLEMSERVTKFEPAMALFVPDNDPLIFYKAICQWGKRTMPANSHIYFEINERMGKEAVEMLSSTGFFNVQLRKDLQGKDRMIRGDK